MVSKPSSSICPSLVTEFQAPKDTSSFTLSNLKFLTVIFIPGSSFFVNPALANAIREVLTTEATPM